MILVVNVEVVYKPRVPTKLKTSSHDSCEVITERKIIRLLVDTAVVIDSVI